MLSLLLGLLLTDIPKTVSADFSEVTIPTQNIQWQALPQSETRVIPPPKKKVEYGRESLGIQITGRAAIVVDVDSGKVLFEKNHKQRGAIASITKLMSALVFLDHNPGWDLEVTLSEGDERNGSYPRIYRGERVRLEDIFYTSLVSSDNNSTIALMRSTGMSEEKFVEAMNRKARDLGLYDTSFVEPTGLREGNVSTPLDISKLIYYAMKDEKISHATTRPVYSFVVLNNNKQRKVYNTDKLLDSYINKTYRIRGGKTGFTYEAGSCLGVQVDNRQGDDIIVVVMGSKDNEHRFQEVKALTQWTFDNYKWD